MKIFISFYFYPYSINDTHEENLFSWAGYSTVQYFLDRLTNAYASSSSSILDGHGPLECRNQYVAVKSGASHWPLMLYEVHHSLVWTTKEGHLITWRHTKIDAQHKSVLKLALQPNAQVGIATDSRIKPRTNSLSQAYSLATSHLFSLDESL